MSELWERDAWELADDVRAGRLPARELLEAHLERIERLDGELNAFWHLDPEGARAAADEVDSRVAAGDDPGPLAGIPMGVKDGTPVAGMPWTDGSLVYRDRVADHDSVVVTRLRGAGAVLVGKTTLPEFGSLNYTRSFLQGVTRNPWNPQRTPGGSSGGSAAAVAAGMVPLATGADGGGSIRIPSSYLGLFGFKVSFGLIPSGPEAHDTSLTSVHGPMARSVRDAARYVDVVSGPSLTDPTTLPRRPVPFEQIVTAGDPADGLRGKRAVWSATFGGAVCDPEVEKVTREAAETLCRETGIELVDVAVDVPSVGTLWGLVSALHMAAWALDDVRDRLEDVTPFPRSGFEVFRDLDPDGLLRAIRRRHEVMTAVAALFDQVDLLLSPTTATVAFAAEGPPPTEIGGQRTPVTGAVPYTMLANLAGWPASSIPAGFVDGLPIGFQVMARRHEDDLPLLAGAVFERLRPWPKVAPVAT